MYSFARQARTAVCGLALISAVSLIGTHSAQAQAMRSGFNSNSLIREDDNSSGAVATGFDMNYFGTTYNNVFVNNNGNVTFTGALAEYNPFGLTSTNTPIVAAFFADVDTRGAASAVAQYGTGVVNGRNAFGATWDGVGYYSTQTNKLNKFQLLLIDRSDVNTGDFDIELNYDQIQWETGSHPSSGGVNGLGGNSARVGYSAGTSAPGSFYELNGSGVNGDFLDGGANSLVTNSLNSGVAGRYVFNVRNGSVSVPSAVPEPGEVATFSLLFGTTGVAILRQRLRRKKSLMLA